MRRKLTYGLSLLFGGLSLVLLITNLVLINNNRDLQETANQRQVEINKATPLTSISRNLIQALAETAVHNDDTAIKDLLAAQGIAVNPTAPKAPTAASKISQ